MTRWPLALHKLAKILYKQMHQLSFLVKSTLREGEYRPPEQAIVADKLYSMPQQMHKHKRRMSKSQAPDIATRTHEDIANGLYECPICTSEVMNNSKVWSCKTCWTVFHMSCIKKWAANEGSTQKRAANESGDIPPPRQWRCPGCNLPKDDMPTTYTCWCAKEVEPRSIPGLPPHSCGQTCSKPRAPRKCPHPCELLCHAGPCPPCPHMGPKQSCYCGKEIAAKRCLETNYNDGWSCEQICWDMMPCGEHFCERPCHQGLCGSCDVVVDAICYCGKVHKKLPCSDRGDARDSTLPGYGGGELQSWRGSFKCLERCARQFDCDKHSCEMECHPQELEVSHCPYSPDNVDHCPCGKTLLDDLGCSRSSCEDPIVHCQKRCDRLLECSHRCQETCHTGDCPPCLEVVEIKCRCGRTGEPGTCVENQAEHPQCDRNCKVLLNCGRHECGTSCCPAEKTASERQRRGKNKASAISRSAAEEFEAEHICTRICSRQLRCGNADHVCQELCHRGACGSCRDAIFDELSCHCGRTVIHPPLPCGTTPPICNYQCNRQKSCGHPQTNHSCHMEDECPKCPYLVQKPCMCGKSQLKNQPCWSTQVNCGQKCGKRLKCGIHFCSKTCHKPGECEDSHTVSCPQICGQAKTAAGCGHPCLDRCHAPSPCKEDKPCQAKIIITCECQNLKKETKCMATKSDEGNSKKTLSCDDECLRLQRNAKLAQALNISSDHLDDHIPYSSTTLDLFSAHIKWSQIQEREFRVFAADDMEKRLRFKPMTPDQRAFLHSLAEDFGLDSESMDPEPHRHVTVFKAPRFVSAPMKTLAQCLKIRATPEVVAPKSQINVVQPFNALLLTAPRFALTIDELRSVLQNDFASAGNPSISISFLPSEEIVLSLPLSSTSSPTIDDGTETQIKRLKPFVLKTIATQSLAAAVHLCRVDSSLNVVRREEDMTALAGGWSQVVKGASAKSRTFGRSVGQKSAFTILGGGSGKAVLGRKKEKEKVEAPVVDDWERDVDAWGES